MAYLIACAVALGWTVFRQGAVLPADRFVSVLAFASISLVLFLLARRSDLAPKLSPWLRWPALLLPAYAVFQFVPLPLPLLGLLSPARAEQIEALGPIVGGIRFASLSVMPSATLRHALTLAGCLLIFLVIRELGWRRPDGQWALAFPLIFIASLEAALGLTQYFLAWPSGLARGTYVNRNHFAGLLEMALPFAVMYPVAVLSRTRSRRRSPLGPVLKASPFLALAALILLGIVHSFSRMGYVASLVSLFVLGAVPLSVRLPARKRWIAVGAIASLIAAGFVLLPPYQLIMRFAQFSSTEHLTTEVRIELWGETLPLIAAYPAFGCGLGGYESAFRKFKISEPLLRDDYVHNDYLQYLAELGTAGFMVAAVLFAVLFGKAARAGVRPEPETRYLGLACTGAMTAILLHSLADFNLYIPANAMVLSWVTGLAAGLEFAVRPEPVWRPCGAPQIIDI